ncbi:MAG: ribonuclease HI family protein [bacterium]
MALELLRIYTDGGARGNPGPAGIGAVLYKVHSEDKEELVAEISEYLGPATNNQAEYTAVIRALARAAALKAENLELRLDSELIVKQLRGEYRVKNEDLAKLFYEVHKLLPKFKNVSIRHVPREKNQAADALVNLALDRALKEKS